MANCPGNARALRAPASVACARSGCSTFPTTSFSADKRLAKRMPETITVLFAPWKGVYDLPSGAPLAWTCFREVLKPPPRDAENERKTYPDRTFSHHGGVTHEESNF